MLIIGCDYHPGFQQIAFVDKETGECGERRLAHREQAEQFYRELHSCRNQGVRLRIPAPGHLSAMGMLRPLQAEHRISTKREFE